jgi:Ca2+-binding RTX toxin-like protein
MAGRRSFQAGLIGAAISLVVISALAATNAVPATRAALRQNPITVDQLKPKPQCNGITVTVLRAGVNGGNGNDLVLGTAGVNNPLRGRAGNDCIHGGGGADFLRGDNGTDICIGGPGTDTFHATCETSIQ